MFTTKQRPKIENEAIVISQTKEYLFINAYSDDKIIWKVKVKLKAREASELLKQSTLKHNTNLVEEMIWVLFYILFNQMLCM